MASQIPSFIVTQLSFYSRGKSFLYVSFIAYWVSECNIFKMTEPLDLIVAVILSLISDRDAPRLQCPTLDLLLCIF